MRTSIGSVLGGCILGLALTTACGGSSHDDPSASAGNAGSAGEVGAGTAGTSTAGASGSSGATSAGNGGADSAGTGGSSGGDDAGEGGQIDSGGASSGGAAGSAGAAGLGGAAGMSGTSGAAGTAGSAGYPVVDIGPQKTSDKLDVLFVVDNSVSMADKQNILSTSLPSFVNRLANPLCVDAQGKPVAQQPASGAVACPSGVRELEPVTNLHLGVISTSIGSHGGNVCATAVTADDHLDDRAELLPSQRTNLASYQNAGYLSYDPTGQAGVANVASVITDLQAMISAAGEHGCGFEAPLEAMYRFLVDPEPPLSVDLVDGASVPTGTNATLLTQRNAFLRPDSAVAVVILSDESDCSIMDSGVGWFVGATSRMPRSTAACDANPNDACCRSCAQRETAPPAGCAALSADPVCKDVPAGQQYVTWDTLHDSLNLRCFNQHQRFGFDLLYPVERYSDALSNPQVRNRAQQLVPNPLLAARAGKGPRSATLISVSLIVGAPWQDLATTASLTPGHELQYLDGKGLITNARWPVLLGDHTVNLPPTDPFMREAVSPRTGTNPLTGTAIVAATSTSPLANPINGHEQANLDLADLQFACTFPLATPETCNNGDSACDCSPDKTGNLDAVVSNNSPLCQPPGGGAASAKQYYGKGYPGARELAFAQQLGPRALAASICPKTLTDTNSNDYAYRPAFSALIGRIATTMK